MFAQLSQFDLHQHIAENATPTLVFFSTDGCSSCRHLKQILLQLQNRHPEWMLYEVDAQKEMGLTSEFEVFHLPAIFLFDQGEYHSEISCAASVSAIEEAVSQALRAQPQEAP